MNIISLIKQVPDTAQLSKTDDGLKLMEEGSPKIVNPWDEYALETALQLKEAHGGKVAVLCLGKPEAAEALKTGLAMGADEAVLISDPAMADSDTLATARILVAAIKKIGDFDLILGGRSAIDGNNAATAVQVAAMLDLPQISYVAELNVEPDTSSIRAVRLLESGRERVSSRYPAVITVVKEINEPRYPSFIGIRKAAKATIPTWGLAELGLAADQVGEAGSQTSWPEVTVPPVREAQAEIIEGSPEEAAKILADKLVAEKVI
jgi:electron transfer flavoprotein beta subunit